MSVGNGNRVGRRVPPEMAPQYLVLAVCKNRQKIRQPKTAHINHDWCWTLIIMTAFRRVLCLRSMASSSFAAAFCGSPTAWPRFDMVFCPPPYIVALQMKNRDVFITISSRLLSALCGIRSSGLGIIDWMDPRLRKSSFVAPKEKSRAEEESIDVKYSYVKDKSGGGPIKTVTFDKVSIG